VEAFAAELLERYLNPAMSGFLGYVVFANARFANPAQLKPEFDAIRRPKLADLLGLWKPGAPPSVYEENAAVGERCVFSGDPAAVRVSRMYIPLITDESNINFVPEGVPMLALSGWCLLALLAMPMGGLASKGRMWVVHSFDPEATRFFAARNLGRNRHDFQMQGLAKRPNYKFARTFVLRDLAEAHGYRTTRTQYPLTTYLFTSSGQKSEVEINHLTAPVLRFMRRAQQQAPDAWQRIVQRAERLKAEAENVEGVVTYNDRNYFYEDLFTLGPADRNHAFLRRYLLRNRVNGTPKGEGKNDPRYTYSLIEESDLVSWSLTELFLREVMSMDQDRIDAIKAIADRIADYVLNQDDRLFAQLFRARDQYEFRLHLLRAAQKASVPFFGLDEFVEAFFTTTDQDMLKFDWQLARDLMIVRVMEVLYQQGRVSIAQSAVVEEAAEASE
jgi:CRISPR-associated protein Cst1